MGNIHTVGPNEALIVSGKNPERLFCLRFGRGWVLKLELLSLLDVISF